MATQTTNYGLKKPSYSDTADIGVINSNMDIIDAKMKEIDDKAGSGGGGTSVTVDSELSTTSENPVQNKVITQALNGKGTYSKPTGGIPKTDLASDVQTSLGKADTALQEHQDISGKADKAEVTALYNSISDVWNSATAYTVGQYCIHNNILWKCLVANTNTEPTEGTYWTQTTIDAEIASVNSSLSDVNTNVNAKVPRFSVNGGFPVIAYSERNISGSNLLEILEKWIMNAFAKHNATNSVIIGYLHCDSVDGLAIVYVWGDSSGIYSASGIAISNSGVYYYLHPYQQSGTLTKIN